MSSQVKVFRAMPQSFTAGVFRNPLFLSGFVIATIVVLVAVFAPFVAPYPEHAGPFVDFGNVRTPPSAQHWLGTDLVGRDVLSRVIFGFRQSLLMAVVVLGLSVPFGVTLGIVAAYFRGFTEIAIMRVTDVFLSIPSLVLAMAVLGVLPPSMLNAMLAVSVTWWPWFTRLAYNVARAVVSEDFITASKVVGASHSAILIRDVFPNCLPTILTKMANDVGFIILVASSLSFLGLGLKPPTPDLGSMVASGANLLPGSWWLTLGPAMAIVVAVMGFALMGDGLRDELDKAKK
ncbi:ABC transporter permease [Shimia aestuarii]|uniref:Peptide/nickel transport system permease protein n=1 Tax=Shimia aestuarii TaxID=254406 RepID=A0A1I4SML5_9RHOB|nr:ABC transporter permease [Shimia aestuarii]SFM65655.1 peptide/nickel transport system permease protein [Shimia aestuarii]